MCIKGPAPAYGKAVPPLVLGPRHQLFLALQDPGCGSNHRPTRHSSSLTTFGPGILNSTRCKAINASADRASGGVLAVPVSQTTLT